jgi:hypothetical protein
MATRNMISKSAPQAKQKEIYITPSNKGLIYGLLSYVSKAKHQIDTRLLDFLCKLLKLAMQAYQGKSLLNFGRGWADAEAAS